ncbi:hypothetical protein PENSPDRAFT_656736, partial [Peniophora sp. CONT]
TTHYQYCPSTRFKLCDPSLALFCAYAKITYLTLAAVLQRRRGELGCSGFSS